MQLKYEKGKDGEWDGYRQSMSASNKHTQREGGRVGQIWGGKSVHKTISSRYEKQQQLESYIAHTGNMLETERGSEREGEGDNMLSCKQWLHWSKHNDKLLPLVVAILRDLHLTSNWLKDAQSKPQALLSSCRVGRVSCNIIIIIVVVVIVVANPLQGSCK